MSLTLFWSVFLSQKCGACTWKCQTSIDDFKKHVKHHLSGQGRLILRQQRELCGEFTNHQPNIAVHVAGKLNIAIVLSVVNIGIVKRHMALFQQRHAKCKHDFDNVYAYSALFQAQIHLANVDALILVQYTPNIITFHRSHPNFLQYTVGVAFKTILQ